MKRNWFKIFVALALILVVHPLIADEDSCGQGGCSGSDHQSMQMNASAPQISYDEFVALKSSHEQFLLIDTRPAESYVKGHIDGALSFPWSEISEETVHSRLPKGVKLVVYCASASCNASATAAQKLKSYGYDAVDYHGGTREWIEKGNELMK